MKLSIIIVSYNTSRVIQECLRSLFEGYQSQFKSNSFEIIVIDNASSDGSTQMLKRKYPNVKLIKSKLNLGFSKANNLAIKKASGEYILFLNPDTLVPKNTLSRMLDYLENNPQVGICTCKVLLPNGQIDDAAHRGFPTPWRALTHFVGLGRLLPFSALFNGYHLGYENMTKIHEIEACAGAFLLIRKDVGDKVNWFDEDYFWYGEDLDLCFRVKQAGYKIIYIPEVSIFHYKGASSGFKKYSQHLAKIDAKTKNRIRQSRFEVMRIFYQKHYRDKYPKWLTQLVFWGIDVKRALS